MQTLIKTYERLAAKASALNADLTRYLDVDFKVTPEIWGGLERALLAAESKFERTQKYYRAYRRRVLEWRKIFPVADALRKADDAIYEALETLEFLKQKNGVWDCEL